MSITTLVFLLGMGGETLANMPASTLTLIPSGLLHSVGLYILSSFLARHDLHIRVGPSPAILSCVEPKKPSARILSEA